MRNTILYKLNKEIEDAKAESKSHYRLAQEGFLKDLVGEEWDQVFEREKEDVFKIIGYEKLWAKIGKNDTILLNNKETGWPDSLYLFHWNNFNFENHLCYIDCRSDIIITRQELIQVTNRYENWLDSPFWKKPFIQKFR